MYKPPSGLSLSPTAGKVIHADFKASPDGVSPKAGGVRATSPSSSPHYVPVAPHPQPVARGSTIMIEDMATSPREEDEEET